MTRTERIERVAKILLGIFEVKRLDVANALSEEFINTIELESEEFKTAFDSAPDEDIAKPLRERYKSDKERILTLKLICNNSKPLVGNDIAPPLKEGEEYSLIDIHICKCGKQHYNVGLPLNVNWVKCYDCKEELPLTNHWSHPSRFTKLEA